MIIIQYNYEKRINTENRNCALLFFRERKININEIINFNNATVECSAR